MFDQLMSILLSPTPFAMRQKKSMFVRCYTMDKGVSGEGYLEPSNERGVTNATAYNNSLLLFPLCRCTWRGLPASQTIAGYSH